jgi:hypothetical protein
MERFWEVTMLHHIRKRYWFILSIILLSLAAPSCGNPKKTILGKWEPHADPLNEIGIEFLEDGTLRQFIPEGLHGRKEGIFVNTGSYEFIDDNHIQVTWPVSRSTGACEVEIAGDMLTLTCESGRQSEYTRYVREKK